MGVWTSTAGRGGPSRQRGSGSPRWRRRFRTSSPKSLPCSRSTASSPGCASPRARESVHCPGRGAGWPCGWPGSLLSMVERLNVLPALLAADQASGLRRGVGEGGGLHHPPDGSVGHRERRESLSSGATRRIQATPTGSGQDSARPTTAAIPVMRMPPVCLSVRLTFLAHTCQVVVDGIHRAFAAVAVAAVRSLGIVMDQPGVQVHLQVFRRRVEP